MRLASLLAVAALALSIAGAGGVALTLARRPARSVLQHAAAPLALPALHVTPAATPSVLPPPGDGALQDAEDYLRDDPVYLPQDTDTADVAAMESVVQGSGGGLYVSELPVASTRFAGDGQLLVDRLCHDLALTGYQPNPTCAILADRQLWLSSSVLSTGRLDQLRRQAASQFPGDPQSALGSVAALLGTELGTLRATEANAAAAVTPEPLVLGTGFPDAELVTRGLVGAVLLTLLWRVLAVRSGRVQPQGRHC